MAVQMVVPQKTGVLSINPNSDFSKSAGYSFLFYKVTPRGVSCMFVKNNNTSDFSTPIDYETLIQFIMEGEFSMLPLEDEKNKLKQSILTLEE